MKQLIKVFLIIASIFTTMLLITKFSGILTIEKIEMWLHQAKNLSPLYAGMIVSALLFADLFIAVPTLSIVTLSGYFLGFTLGALFSLLGIFLAGIVGYILSRYYGKKILTFLIKNSNERVDAIEVFRRHGFVIILLSRAMPIMPETSACLSGATRMSFWKFLFAWTLSSVPYVLIASYAGSISTLQNPKPAIIMAIAVSAFFAIAWFFYRKKYKAPKVFK